VVKPPLANEKWLKEPTTMPPTPAERSAEHHRLGRYQTSQTQQPRIRRRSSHQRQGDRAFGDDDTAALLPVYVRFHDLRAAGIVSKWPQLYNLIEDNEFPEGVLLSPNCRAWPLSDVERWLASRPSQRKKIAAGFHTRTTAASKQTEGNDVAK
jgi:hypothetical protein